MKFLALVDLHGDKKILKELIQRAKEPDIDFVLCAGDLSQFGRGLPEVLQQFNQLGKELYLIPGNHEEKPGLLENLLPAFPHCHNLHRQAVRLGHYLFLGHGGDGFAQEDAGFRKIAREWYSRFQTEKIVLVTHGPPFGTKVDWLNNQHVGNHDYRRFIERIEPKLVICGHFHETAGMVDTINGTKVVNPGWEGMVIELK